MKPDVRDFRNLKQVRVTSLWVPNSLFFLHLKMAASTPFSFLKNNIYFHFKMQMWKKKKSTLLLSPDILLSWRCWPLSCTFSELTLMLQHSLYHLVFRTPDVDSDDSTRKWSASLFLSHPSTNPFLEIAKFKLGTWKKASQNGEKELSYSLILAQSLPWPMHDAHLKHRLLQHDSPWERTRLCTTQLQSFRYQRGHEYSWVTETLGNRVIHQAVARWWSMMQVGCSSRAGELWRNKQQ